MQNIPTENAPLVTRETLSTTSKIYEKFNAACPNPGETTAKICMHPATMVSEFAVASSLTCLLLQGVIPPGTAWGILPICLLPIGQAFFRWAKSDTTSHLEENDSPLNSYQLPSPTGSSME